MSVKEKSTSKFLHAAAASYILGESSNVKIVGSPGKIETFKRVILSSKRLYEALNKEGIRMESVQKLLQEKEIHAREFQKETGLVWQL
jgi:hypothetical protein